MGVAFKKVLSKYVGVTRYFHKWRVFTGGGNNLKWHGGYDTEKEAARVRNRMMIERFGFDPNPNVIEGSEAGVTRYSVSGDAEFIIRAISHMRLRGNGTLHIVKQAGDTDFSLRGRMKTLAPLLAAQPYILDVVVNSTAVCDVDMNECTLDIGGPWLSVPEVKPSARVVFHRRHTFKSVPLARWVQLSKKFHGEYAFVGSASDSQFLRSVAHIRSMPLLKASNLLVAAQFIAGAELFVGNQSPMAEIAKGLGIKTVIEGTKEFDELTTPVSPTPVSFAHEGSQSLE